MLKIAFSPIYKYSLPKKHRFPMEKYELLPEQLIYEGTITESNFFHPKPLAESTILLTHEKEIREIGFPMSENLVERGRHIADGTVQAALYAQQFGIAMNIAGGTHHSYKKILVVDLDVHQGDGTAQIFQSENRVFTFSMHGAKNFPLRKQQSDLDIGLPDKTEDAFYLKTLRATLPKLLAEVQPDFIFYLSGVDVIASDKLGRLSLSIAGCKERDQIVLQACKDHEIPVAVSMGGGYSEKLAHIIEAHANTYRVAQHIFF